MVRAESAPRLELKMSILDGKDIRIGKVIYRSRVVKGESYCYKCDFVRVKGMFPILLRNRVCSCCLEADRYIMKSRHSHILKKVGEIVKEDDDESGITESDENDNLKM